jgi:hypothetical protein
MCKISFDTHVHMHLRSLFFESHTHIQTYRHIRPLLTHTYTHIRPLLTHTYTHIRPLLTHTYTHIRPLLTHYLVAVRVKGRVLVVDNEAAAYAEVRESVKRDLYTGKRELLLFAYLTCAKCAMYTPMLHRRSTLARTETVLDCAACTYNIYI